MTEEEYNEKLNMMDKCVEYWMEKAKKLEKQLDWKEKALAKAKRETKRIADRVNKDKRRLIRRKRESADILTKAKEMIKELYEGLDKLYLSGLSAKQIAFIEQLQDKAEQFLKEE